MSKKLTLTVIGDGMVGKTSLLLAYIKGQNSKIMYTPTIMETYNELIISNGISYEVIINDTTGQDGYDKLRQMIYPQTDIFLLCYDVTNQLSYEQTQNWTKEVRNCVNRPIVLVGCKTDLANDKLKVEKSGNALKKKLKAKTFYTTSAITGEGVKEAIEGSLSSTTKRKRKCSLV